MQSTENDDWKPESGLDVLLILLYAPEGSKGRTPISGITRLDKLMFLLSRYEEFEGLFRGEYDFIAYNFGPFATELLDDLEALKSQGLIQTEERNPDNASQTRDAEIIDEETGELNEDEVTWNLYRYEVYSLTPIGVEIAEKLYSGATETQRELVGKIKMQFNSKSLTGLLRYVYRTYPKFATKSKIRNKILDGM